MSLIKNMKRFCLGDASCYFRSAVIRAKALELNYQVGYRQSLTSLSDVQKGAGNIYAEYPAATISACTEFSVSSLG